MTDDGATNVPKRINNYEIIKPLDSGGYGQVYLGKHIYLPNRFVAIKLLKSQHVNSPSESMSFLQDARFLDMIKHPHIIPLVDVGYFEGTPYIITEYIINGSLRSLLQTQSPHLLPEDASLVILSQIGDALSCIHQNKIVHGDLKPENILLRKENDALLTDFGNATFLGTENEISSPVIKGTPAYMAPEQFRGTIRRESDQFAIGCIAYELFTGQLPFTASGFATWNQKYQTEAPEALRNFNPSLLPHIEEATLKALEKDFRNRYTDVSILINELLTTVDHAGPLKSNAYSTHSNVDPPDTKPTTAATVTPPTPVVQYSEADVYNATAAIISTPQQNRQAEPPQSLNNLQISDPAIRDLLTALLQDQSSEFYLKDDIASNPNTFDSYHYTCIYRIDQPLLTLLHIHHQLLQNKQYSSAFSILVHAFPKNSMVILFLDNSELPIFPIRNVLEEEWQVHYVTRSDIEFIERECKNSPPDKRKKMLARLLKFEDVLQKSLLPSQLEAGDQGTLVSILKGIRNAIDEGALFWREQFEKAGLKDLIISFEGDPGGVAWNVIDRLKFAHVPVPPNNEGKEALGLFLQQILQINDLPIDKKETIKSIMKKYGL